MRAHGGDPSAIERACIDTTRSLRQRGRQVAAQRPDQLGPLSCRGAGQRGDERGAARRDT